MPAKEICVENGFMISATQQGPGSPNAQGFQYVKIPSPKMKCDNKAALVQMLTTIGAACTASGGKCTGSGMINATAAKTKSNFMPVLRKGDTGTCIGVAMVTAGPAVVPMPTTCKLEITNAGQTKVKGE